MTEQLLTPKELAEKLGVKTSTIYHWSHIGFIPRVKLGNLLRFKWSSITKWLENIEETGRPKRKYIINPDKLL